jgi:CheY-like chemotaxis protein
MKILLLDDLPDVRELYAERLKKKGYQVLALPDMTGALRMTKQQAKVKAPFDLLAIDLMLKRFEPEFANEQEKLAKARAQKQQSNIPSGQALGLRLWNSPPRQPYCYLSEYPGLWVAGVDQEFDGATDTELALLRMPKERISSAELGTKLDEVVALWKQKGW